MNLSETLEKALNDQIRLEFESVFAYLQMAVDFQRENFDGFAHWMRLQSQEEWAHAMKFTDFVLNRGGSVALQTLDAPTGQASSPVEAFERTLGHERKVSAAIQNLYGQALNEGDFAALPLLQWFVNEQIEEEATVDGIVERLRMVGSDSTGILFIDRERASRTASPQTPAE